MSLFIDGNVLIYLIGDDVRDTPKQTRARDLLDRPGCVLWVQVLNEFVWQATHSHKARPLKMDEAIGLLRTFGAHRIVPIDMGVFDAAAQVAGDTN